MFTGAVHAEAYDEAWVSRRFRDSDEGQNNNNQM
jgi:hypothetical protein